MKKNSENIYWKTFSDKMPRYLFFISSVFKILNLKKFNFLKMGPDFVVLPLKQFIFVQKKTLNFVFPKSITTSYILRPAALVFVRILGFKVGWTKLVMIILEMLLTFSTKRNDFWSKSLNSLHNIYFKKRACIIFVWYLA